MPAIKDITGQRFGRLIAIRPTAARRDRKVVWECQCDCGVISKPTVKDLLSGNTRSCGCLQRERSLAAMHKASTIHGLTATRTWNSWKAAKGRCFCKTDLAFPRYGGRGITMCERWRNSFKNFLADMGERPAGRSIDRIDNNGNYEPGNCRWATPREQLRNRRRVNTLTA